LLSIFFILSGNKLSEWPGLIGTTERSTHLNHISINLLLTWRGVSQQIGGYLNIFDLICEVREHGPSSRYISLKYLRKCSAVDTYFYEKLQSWIIIYYLYGLKLSVKILIVHNPNNKYSKYENNNFIRKHNVKGVVIKKI
jgi:hypothetical protein